VAGYPEKCVTNPAWHLVFAEISRWLDADMGFQYFGFIDTHQCGVWVLLEYDVLMPVFYLGKQRTTRPKLRYKCRQLRFDIERPAS
jgi:hypothetical protein